MATETEQRPSAHRFVAVVDGEDAGFTQYRERDGVRTFTHTVVDDRFGGQGVASQLIRSALDRTREQGLRIVAVCPFVAAYVQRHHDWDDLLDPATEE